MYNEAGMRKTFHTVNLRMIISDFMLQITDSPLVLR